MDMMTNEVVVEEKVNETVGRYAHWIQMVFVGHMVFVPNVTTLVKPAPPINLATKNRRHETTP